MDITLIARPAFLGIPEGAGEPGPDPMQGPDAERLVEFAGRTCYDSLGRGRGSPAFHANLLSVRHGSVLEHAHFSFLITGVSRNLMAELTRHHAGHAYSIRSTRYVDEAGSPIAYHPLIEKLFRESREIRQLWAIADAAARDAYCASVSTVGASLLQLGVDEATARKQARGAARGILPSALATRIVWTANIRALRHAIEMRVSEAADAEIRLLGMHILEIMSEEAPAYFSDYDMEFCPDGTRGLVASMAELAGSMDRLAKNLSRVLDILIPPDGTKGVVARLEDIETAREDAKEWRKWFYRALGATIITAIIGMMVAFIR